ncbi:MAG TPA: metalloregulator ArsR/SmtB family transcription factor [Verrucomicrobiae bacterium]|nr:metalloregulator ArsR/SmtB family transcription factor [Verrucomicrobiae bacterium]
MSIAKTKRNLTDPELERVARHFKQLGEMMRLKILQAICKKPLTVSGIVEATGATQANVSKHLSLLAAAGIVTREKAGQRVYYGMKDPLTVKMCELVYTQLTKSG